jgi:hypothetical protein
MFGSFVHAIPMCPPSTLILCISGPPASFPMSEMEIFINTGVMRSESAVTPKSYMAETKWSFAKRV